jgi:hypothetical protein
MPIYNERDTIQEVLLRVQAVPVDKEIVIVDDASTDGTQEVLKGLEKNPGIRVFYHKQNQGKGAALRTGFKECRGDIVLVHTGWGKYFEKEPRNSHYLFTKRPGLVGTRARERTFFPRKPKSVSSMFAVGLSS